MVQEYPALFEVTTDDLGKLGKEGFQVLKRRKWLGQLEGETCFSTCIDLYLSKRQA